jgi:DUF4097 and DUF4098 domain-containing protein YvlB
VIARQFAVSGPPTIDVQSPSAEVTVDSSSDATVAVQIDSKRDDGWVVEQHGDSISIRDERSGWRGGRARIRIVTPDLAGLQIATASGDIEVRARAERAQVSSTSGDIRIATAATVTAKTASGAVDFHRITADAQAKSASGDISASTVGGVFTASTASGDVRAEHVGGEVRVNTASGDVRIGRFEGREFTANTVSGDVTLGLPPGRSVDLDVRTVSGDVSLPDRRSGDPAPQSPHDAPHPRVTIRVKSVSGDFNLRALSS